jgi:tRNA/rRNA methyltransferase
MALANIAFVLVRPRSAGNIGAAARALKNMGFADLRLVAPAARNRQFATAMAVHAADVLGAARGFDDLDSALTDCTITVGTTCRTGLYRSGAGNLRANAPELAALARRNRVAIIFGPEDHGLTNDELKRCQRLITIPTAADYPALNLAQAVMVVAYELGFAVGTAAHRGDGAREFARAAEVDAMLARMADALVAIGFLPEDNPDHIMFALRGVLGRSGLTPRELDIFSGIARQMRWAADGGHAALDAKRRAGRKLR